MSLNWDLTDCKNGKELNSKISDAIIWRTIPVGMGIITDANWEEFYERSVICDKVLGVLLFEFGEKDVKHSYITKEEVRKRIGLRTNASRKSKARFVKDIMQQITEDALEDNKAAERYIAKKYAVKA